MEVIRSLNQGGAQQLLVNRLQSARAEHETLVVNAMPSEAALAPRIRSSGVEVLDIGMARPDLFLRNFLAAYRGFDPDVVVVHSPSVAAVLKLMRASRVLRKPVVEVIHNTQYNSRAVQWAATATNRGADLTLVVSKGAKDTGLVRGARSVQVLHHGVPVSEMRAHLGERRRSENDMLNVIYCSRLVPEKRPMDLVSALRLIPQPRRIHLTFVGTGPERERIELAVAEADLQDDVLLLGEVPDGWRLIAESNILALPSEHEGLPVVLMEALALGVPVLSTRIPGITDILTDNSNAVLNEVGDVSQLAASLVRLRDDRAELDRLAQGAWLSADAWDARHTDRRFYQLLGEASGGPEE